MELYVHTRLPEKVKELFAEKDDPILVSQDVPYSESLKIEEHLPAIVDHLCSIGQICVLATDNMAIMVRRKTAWVCEIDTKVRKGTSAREVIKTYKQFAKLLGEKTHFLKCESRTPLKHFAETMARAVGASIEGVCKKSFRTKEGTMIDEYLVGFIIKEETPCQQ